MVLQGENSGNSHSLSKSRKNWLKCRTYGQCTANSKRPTTTRQLHESRDFHNSKTMEESVKLKREIRKIEKQNSAQQRRLQELENLVMQLMQGKTSQVVPCLPVNSSVFTPDTAMLIGDKEREDIAPCSTDYESQIADCRTGEEDRFTSDIVSLMEEFDRNGRENGIVYGVTPTHTLSDAHDIDLDLSSGVSMPNEDVCNSTSLQDVHSSPLPIFITPSHQDCTHDNYDSKNAEEPQHFPQICFTTPALLTSKALKEANQNQDQVNNNDFDCKKWTIGVSPKPVTWSKKECSSSSIVAKTNPFSNLLPWIQQTSESNAKQHTASGMANWHAKDQHDSLHLMKAQGFCSPWHDSVCSVSERVYQWSQSLRLPLLSPMSESLCSDKDKNASDEEELVVDEAVSHSVAVGRRRQQRRQRQRNESVCSFAGGCVAPDLLLAPDTGGTCLGQVREEDIMTEIAGELDCSMLIEESQEKPKNEQAKALKKEIKEERRQMKAGKGKRRPLMSVKKEMESDFNSVVVKKEVFEVVEEPVSDEDLNSDKDESQPSDKKLPIQQPSVVTQGKDMKLPAGSVILAMVNEAGSLVPLPQFKVDRQALSDALDHTPEEDVDVETVSEKTPVLEAGDLASLLAQFEASEAVNTTGSDTSDVECLATGTNKESTPVVSTDSFQTPTTEISQHKKALQGSPTHQNIKDALPKEIIEKIKASTKRKTTQMLSEPVAVRKGRVTKTKETSSSHRSKGSRATSQQQQQPHTPTGPQQNQKDLRVPPPLDHDYCCSPDKTKRGNRMSSDRLFNKLPDYYTTVPSKDGDIKKSGTSSDDGQDDVGKKDSGVESGDVSDASVETEERRKEGKDSRMSLKPASTSGEKVKEEIVDKGDIYNKLPAYVTDISNVKPKDDEIQEEAGTEVKVDEEEPSIQKQETKKHKRKLNLSEYRQRIKSTQSSRCPSPASSITSTVANSPQQATEGIEGTPISTQTMAEEQDVMIVSKEPLPEIASKEDMEEGELEGDSEPEILTRVNPDAMDTEVSSEINPVHVESQMKSGENTLGNLVFYKNSSTKPDTHWKVGSHQGLSSRRWSSSSRSRSRSRSRSHSRSPVLNKKRHSHKHHHSSHSKRRRGYRASRSSQSPRPWRRWSRSRSRSRSRNSSSSSSHSHSYSSSRSRSRSRSRSCSSKTRDRWAYWRWGSSRKRHSRSGSRSGSSRYRGARSRSRSRSRSPIWRDAGRSRSSSRTLPGRPRRAEDEHRVKQVEERRVIYIGRISEGTTKTELRTRFEKYGTIVDISVHFREHGDNYGFVTYQNRDEAYCAVEHGNEDPKLPRYDLCFGGRRAFCKVSYSDLDAEPPQPYESGGSQASPTDPLDFDSLLRAAMKRNVR